MKMIGLIPGEPFDADRLETNASAAINEAAQEALADMISAITDHTPGAYSNGWGWIHGGTYGTNYRLRAMVALAGLDCNLSEDAIYPQSHRNRRWKFAQWSAPVRTPARGRQPSSSRCVLSLTMYTNDTFQVSNALNRFAIGDRDALASGYVRPVDDAVRSGPGHGRAPHALGRAAAPRQVAFAVRAR